MDEFAGLTEEEIKRVQRCLWLEFDCRDSWIKAIQFSPKLAAYCNCWHNFTTMDWARLLSDNIQFINMAPLHKMTFAEWVVVLNKQPSLADRCPISDEMPDFIWSKIQQKYPPRKRKTKADNCKEQRSLYNAGCPLKNTALPVNYRYTPLLTVFENYPLGYGGRLFMKVLP